MRRERMRKNNKTSRVGVEPRVIPKSSSSRATHYIHRRPSPSPAVNAFYTRTPRRQVER